MVAHRVCSCEHLLYQFRIVLQQNFPPQKKWPASDASSGLPGLPVYFRSHIHSQMSDKYVFLPCFLHSMHCILQAPQMLCSQPEVFPLPENSDPSFLLAASRSTVLPDTAAASASLFPTFSDASALFPPFISVLPLIPLCLSSAPWYFITHAAAIIAREKDRFQKHAKEYGRSFFCHIFCYFFFHRIHSGISYLYCMHMLYSVYTKIPVMIIRLPISCPFVKCSFRISHESTMTNT